jgi:hypothetical protein
MAMRPLDDARFMVKSQVGALRVVSARISAFLWRKKNISLSEISGFGMWAIRFLNSCFHIRGVF